MPPSGPPAGPHRSDVIEGGVPPGGLAIPGLIVVLLLLLVLGWQVGGRVGGDPTAPARLVPAAPGTADPVAVVDGPHGSCVGKVTLLGSSGAQVPVAVNSPPALTVAVGEVLSLMATGPCYSALWMSPQRGGVFVVEAGGVFSATQLRALVPGIVRIGVTHWVCVERPTYDPACRGLIALDGYVDVIVVRTPP